MSQIHILCNVKSLPTGQPGLGHTRRTISNPMLLKQRNLTPLDMAGKHGSIAQSLWDIASARAGTQPAVLDEHLGPTGTRSSRFPHMSVPLADLRGFQRCNASDSRQRLTECLCRFFFPRIQCLLDMARHQHIHPL
jgi:hypothetical protein